MATHQPIFRVLLRMQIHPGLEQEFEQTWYQVGKVVTDHPANIGQWLAKSQDEDGVYYIISDWTDEPRFREFEHSADHLAHRTRLHPFRSGGSMTTMQVVYAMTGAAQEDGCPPKAGTRSA
jgi:heme-degrading monooxygenase HmoA